MLKHLKYFQNLPENQSTIVACAQLQNVDLSSVGWSPSGVSLGEGVCTDRLSKPDPSSVGRSPSGVSLGEGAVGGSGAVDRYAIASDMIYRQAQKVLNASQYLGR